MSESDPGKEKPSSSITAFARYATIGITLPAATFSGYLIGLGLDHVFGTSFLRVVFLVLGTIAGFIQVIRGLTGSVKD